MDRKASVSRHAFRLASRAARQNVPELFFYVIQPPLARRGRDETQTLGFIIAAVCADLEVVEELLRRTERDVVQRYRDSQSLGVEFGYLNSVRSLVLGLHHSADHENAAMVLHKVHATVHTGQEDVIRFPQAGVHVESGDPRLALRGAHQLAAFHHRLAGASVVVWEIMAGWHIIEFRPRHRLRVVQARNSSIVINENNFVASVEIVHNHSYKLRQSIRLSFFPAGKQPPRASSGIANSHHYLPIGGGCIVFVGYEAQQSPTDGCDVEITKRDAI